MNIFALNDDTKRMPSEEVINAASFGRADRLVKALNDGGDPNFVRLDVSATLISVLRNYPECLQILVDNNARSDIPNRQGWTAIHEACLQENPEALSIILSNLDLVDVGVRDKKGETPLFAAMSKDRLANAGLLVQAYPDIIHRADNNGVYPLLWAVEQKKLEWVEWCIRNGADPKQEDSKGRSALSEVSEWPEGKELMESLSLVVPQVQRLEKPTRADVKEEATVEEAKPANPFGLGGVKKKSMG